MYVFIYLNIQLIHSYLAFLIMGFREKIDLGYFDAPQVGSPKIEQ